MIRVVREKIFIQSSEKFAATAAILNNIFKAGLAQKVETIDITGKKINRSKNIGRFFVRKFQYKLIANLEELQARCGREFGLINFFGDFLQGNIFLRGSFQIFYGDG